MNKYAVIGLGYVGLGLAMAFAQRSLAWGYDIDKRRIDELKHQVDRNSLIKKNELESSTIQFTDNLEDIREANFYIVAVATPAYFYELPNLKPLISAVKALATILKKNDVVVFESTVYPGTTDEICVPLLEQISQMKSGQDFFVGYSPERINPCDEKHTLYNIPKVVSGQDKATLKRVQNAYETICETVCPVSSMAVAEAVKILENTQRDVNIAFMNEFSMVMHALNLDTHEIIEGAKTKWSFLPYKPGLVGGHCISIDPLYLAFQAKRHGVNTNLLYTARKINDGMTGFIIQSLVKLLINNNVNTSHSTIGIFGISYKENTIDSRNSLSLKLVKELCEYGFKCVVNDPFDHDLESHQSPVVLNEFKDMENLSVAIILVAHDFYKEAGLKTFIDKCVKPAIVMDIPNLFVNEGRALEGIIYWNL